MFAFARQAARHAPPGSERHALVIFAHVLKASWLPDRRQQRAYTGSAAVQSEVSHARAISVGSPSFVRREWSHHVPHDLMELHWMADDRGRRRAGRSALLPLHRPRVGLRDVPRAPALRLRPGAQGARGGRPATELADRVGLRRPAHSLQPRHDGLPRDRRPLRRRRSFARALVRGGRALGRTRRVAATRARGPGVVGPARAAASLRAHGPLGRAHDESSRAEIARHAAQQVDGQHTKLASAGAVAESKISVPRPAPRPP